MSQNGEGSQSAAPVETDAVNKEPHMGSPTTTTLNKSRGMKRKVSQVWNHFTKIEASKGVFKGANCNYCNKKFNWRCTSGTSSLDKHLRGRCPKFSLNDTYISCYRSPRSEYKSEQLKNRRDLAVACLDKQLSPRSEYKSDQLKNRRDLAVACLDKQLRGPCPKFSLKTLNDTYISCYRSPRSEYKFDQLKSRRDLAMACIKHNYPFNIGEHDYFEAFLNGLNPDFKLPSSNTITTDVVGIYEEEKVKINSLLDNLSCKVSLTTNIWTSEYSNKAYCCITAHFINDSWELHKKILAFKLLEYPHDIEKLFNFMKDWIIEWNLGNKLSSIVVDNAIADSYMIRKLKFWLVSDSLIPSSGALLHLCCSAHILNLIAQDGLSEIRNFLDYIRKTVRYLERTPSAMQKFERAKQQCKLQDKRALANDVPTRWDSTFELLETALSLRDAFVRLGQIDQGYSYNPLAQEWDAAAIIVECLRTFYEVTRIFSGSKYPTSNVFFPSVCDIHLKLIQWEKSEHECLRKMCTSMKYKFLKYWEECNLSLAIAVVFDPRCKIYIVKYLYTKIYGEDAAVHHISMVQNQLKDLYVLYGGSGVPSSRIASSSSSAGIQSSLLKEFNQWYVESHASSLQQSELEIYLNEPILHQDDKFDVLKWWSYNASRFPILQKIARDILAIPATTVPLESAFNLGGCIIDEARSKLSPNTIEALIVANDWIPTIKEKVPRDEALGALSEGDENEALGALNEGDENEL